MKQMGGTFDIGQEFERRKGELPGGGAVAQLRKQGIEDFLIKGLPTAKTEGWRYADLKRLDAKRLPPVPARQTPAAAPVTDWPFAAASGEKIKLARQIPGASMKSAAEVLQAKDALGENLFLPAAGDHPFDQLNRAFAKEGFVLDIASGAKISGLEIVMASAGMREGARYMRNLIRIGAGATATLFLRTLSTDDGGWLNAVTKIQIGEGAHLTLYGGFESGKEVLLSSLAHVAIARNGRFSYRPLAVGVLSLR
ncbi:MAG TPA: hypothetical protein VD713_05485, partial [Sphingomonadales bacterium]|nr:hypothetical protein [Sphingomonadales bacterium]